MDSNYKSNPQGVRITCTFFGVPEHLLNNPTHIRSSMEEALAIERFHILAFVDHRFEPQGYTGLALLSESHLSVHTYPEYRSAVFDLYSCRDENDGQKVFDHLTKAMQPARFDRLETLVPIVERPF